MGFIVGLSGVDGSGKTTIAKLLVEKLRDRGHRAMYHHELDLVLFTPIFRLLRRLTRKKAMDEMKKRVIFGTWRGKPLYSHLYYLIICLDTVIAYFYFKFSRGVIVCDRWSYDVVATFVYRNYHNRIIERLLLSTPRPDIMILLTVPSEVACLRKKDDDALAYLNYDLRYYQITGERIYEIAQRLSYDAMIDSNRPVSEVAEDILQLIEEREDKVISPGLVA